ncbi:hypothetical protein ACLX1H_006496 [Fusarium chlamydosporum]
MTSSIALESLPVVFQQAILVTRALKVDYIWIDSLCIIQDSQSDWELESSKMCNYYENSFLTLSTASSPNPNFPFLGLRDKKWRPVDLEILTQTAREFFHAQRIPRTPEEEGKLFTRGWAWQESAMSSRIAYFTPSELIWECSEHVIPQRYIPDRNSSDRLGFSKILSRLRFGFPLRSSLLRNRGYGLDYNPSDASSDISGKHEQTRSETQNSQTTVSSPTPSVRSGHSGTEPMDYVWDEWGDLVSYYSRRELTFFLDKLPALSGVASRVHGVTKSQYLAGMWRDSLPVSLCWIQDDRNRDILALPDAYVAPSWSWASVRGRVEAQIERTITSFEPSATILEAECHVPGLNPFGRVSGGHLTLRGQISEAMLACDDPHKVSHYEINGSEREWYFYPDSALISSNGKVFRAKEGQVLSEFI